MSFWLQMSEPITHLDTDNCMTIHHHKGTSYFDSTAHLMCFVHSFKRNDKLSFIVIIAYIVTCVCHSGCRWVNQVHTWTHIITLYISNNGVNKTHQMCSGIKKQHVPLWWIVTQLSLSMCVIGSLICNQNDKLYVIMMIPFLQCARTEWWLPIK